MAMESEVGSVVVRTGFLQHHHHPTPPPLPTFPFLHDIAYHEICRSITRLSTG